MNLKIIIMEELRKKLKVFVPYEDCKKIRKQIRALAIKTYKQRYSDTEHMGFIKKHEISVKVVGFQQSNFPYYYEMFSVITQHIYADTIEELFDKAIDIEKASKGN